MCVTCSFTSHLTGGIAAFNIAVVLQAITAIIYFVIAASSVITRSLAAVSFVNTILFTRIKLIIGVAFVGAFVLAAAPAIDRDIKEGVGCVIRRCVID